LGEATVNKCKAPKAEIGFDVAETHLNEVYFNQVEPLRKIVVETEAQTRAGLRAKVSVLGAMAYPKKFD
jgi:hypothetical protein